MKEIKIEMKGQPKAIAQAENYVAGIFRNPSNPIRPALISGPSGVGKSHLVNQIVTPFRDAGWNIAEIPSASEAFRTLASFESLICENLDNGALNVIVIDEAHALKGGAGLSKAAILGFSNALFPWGFKEPLESSIALGREENPKINWRETCIILATNSPEDLEQSTSRKKGETPFKRRCVAIDLSPYDSEVIGEVIGDFLTAQGLRAAECSRNAIARFHRGTLGAISDVVRSYKSMFPNQPTISKERLIEAAKLTDWLPRGLSKFEGRLLKVLAGSSGSIRKDGVAVKVGCEPSLVPSMIATLDSQKDNKGNHCPFAVVQNSIVRITKPGEQYLSAIVRDGFTF